MNPNCTFSSFPKRYYLLGLLGLLLMSAACDRVQSREPHHEEKDIKDDPGYLTVMTYNIRYDNPDDGVNRWDKRKETVAEAIRFFDADVIGIQEGLYHQVQYLEQKLANYSVSGVGRKDGKKAGEFSAILYNTQKFKLLQDSTFWLSPTKTKPSVGWDAALPRICSWAEFNIKGTDRNFYFFNTHFDHIGKKARRESAKLILHEAHRIAGTSPIVLTGDFNSTPDTEVYAILTGRNDDDGAYLSDAMQVATYPHYGPLGTYYHHGGGFNVDSGKDGEKIDYIFVSDEVKVIHHAISGMFRDGRFPSDHLPVISKILIE